MSPLSLVYPCVSLPDIERSLLVHLNTTWAAVKKHLYVCVRLDLVQQSAEGLISTPPTISSTVMSTYPAMNRDACASNDG